jgi:hypothetical protein
MKAWKAASMATWMQHQSPALASSSSSTNRQPLNKEGRPRHHIERGCRPHRHCPSAVALLARSRWAMRGSDEPKFDMGARILAVFFSQEGRLYLPSSRGGAVYGTRSCALLTNDSKSMYS